MYYLLGKSFWIETDHKPLVATFTKYKDFEYFTILSVAILIMSDEIQLYNGLYTCSYILDMLSRTPISSSRYSTDLQKSVEVFISSIISTLPASPDCLAKLHAAQAQDKILSQVTHYCKTGWPQLS